MATKNTVLVSGATGQQGGAVARELLSHGYSVKAMTRKPTSDRAKSLQKLGAEIVQADLNNGTSLEKAFEGVWGAFAVQNTWEAGVEQEEIQGKLFAAIAKNAGVQHFVYSSVGSAQRNTGIPHFDNKWRIEETIRELKFPSYVIIRPAFFMENWLSPWFKPGIDQGKVMIGIAATTKLQMSNLEDIGKYGLLAFEKHQELKGKAIDIASDELIMPEVALVLSKVTGKPFTFEQVPIELIRQNSADFASMLEWFDKVGYNADIKGNAKSYNIKSTSFAEWAKKQKWL
jgi:uncharacterized protein YbjT (DUF2867 family)